MKAKCEPTIDDLATILEYSFKRWQDIFTNGCQDHHW